LSPHSQGVAVTDEKWLAVLALAGELGLPVNLHVTDPLSGAYPGRVETPLADFRSMARAFPHVKFILAHWGGQVWRDGGALPDNVWVDTAATPLLYGQAPIWEDGLRACGAERVLWGTDYPLELYPRDNRGTFAGFLAEARGKVPAESVDDVLGGNAHRLFRV
jgi:predicted TIM-barrel fold metal-dependent hydrolase